MQPTPHDLSRRGFIAAAGTLAAGAALAAGARPATAQEAAQVVEGPEPPNALVGRPAEIEEPLPAPEEARLGWAVAGLGHFATTYQIPALGRARHSKLAGLVSGNPDKAAQVAAAHDVPEGSVYSYDSFDAIADDPAIDVVYVVTPNSLHRDLVVRAFQAGKHVMVEKPMGISAADCEAMIAARDAAGRKLMVAYRAHFEPRNVELARMIEAGELGRIAFLSSDHHRPLDPQDPKDQWRVKKALAGGGSFTDIGIYALNGALWFMNEPVAALSARTHAPEGDPRFAEVEDVATVQLRFASGRLATLSSGYTADKKRIDAWGEDGVAVLDPATEYSGNRLMLKTPEGSVEVRVEDPSEVQFVEEIDHLSRAIKDGTEVKTPAEMGLRDCRLIEAAYASAAEAGRWVELDAEGRMRG